MKVKIYRNAVYRRNYLHQRYDYQCTKYQVYADLPEGEVKWKKLLYIDSITIERRGLKKGVWGVKEIIRKWYPDTEIDFQVEKIANETQNW